MTRIEYRAVYRTPLGYGATEEDKDRGYMIKYSGYGTTTREVQKNCYDLSNAIETQSTLLHWDRRYVEVGEWAEYAVRW